jgi:hypothetical protein
MIGKRAKFGARRQMHKMMVFWVRDRLLATFQESIEAVCIAILDCKAFDIARKERGIQTWQP